VTATHIRLCGDLGKRFGRSHSYHLESRTTTEAMAALASQVRGVREYFADAHKRSVRFAVFVGKRNIPADMLGLPANDEIRIMPVIAGAKNEGALQYVEGIALIMAHQYVAGYAMIIGGAMQMYSSVPRHAVKLDKQGDQPNTRFNGVVNAQAQDNPVPLLYGGPLKVGSIVISAGIDTLDSSYVPSYSNPKIGDMGGGYWLGRSPGDGVIREAP
jgi:predicted phage tail protein